jgi:hypothetical protein
VRTSKKKSAKRQIIAAIGHFHNGAYDIAITLAGAGENQVEEKTTTHLFKLIRAKFSKDETNKVYNWMKHPSGDQTITIDELEPVTMIIRAIQKYVGTYQETCPSFEEFSQWCMDRGYTKGPLTEKAEA